MGVTLKSIFDAPFRRAPLAEGVWFAENWHWESQPVWSRDRTCGLIFDAPRAEDATMLVIELLVFNAGPARQKTLRIESAGHAPLRVEIADDGPNSFLVQRPLPRPGADTAGMLFHLDTIDSPAALGQSADDRFLGLTIDRVIPFREDLALPLDCSLETVHAAYLREGWEQPEPGGTWSSGSGARIALPSFLHNGQRALSFDFEVLPRPEGVDPLDVTVEIDGRACDHWICTPGQAGPRLCPLPARRPTDRDLEIVFRVRNPLSPQELSINEDPRPLGLRLRRINAAQTETA